MVKICATRVVAQNKVWSPRERAAGINALIAIDGTRKGTVLLRCGEGTCWGGAGAGTGTESSGWISRRFRPSVPRRQVRMKTDATVFLYLFCSFLYL